MIGNLPKFISVAEHNQTEQRATFIAPEMCTECAYHLKCIHIERPERLPIPSYFLIKGMGNSKGHNMIEVTQHGRLRAIRSCVLEIRIIKSLRRQGRYGRTDRRTDGQTDGLTYRQTDKQTEMTTIPLRPVRPRGKNTMLSCTNSSLPLRSPF